jgi:hypothetical protein
MEHSKNNFFTNYYTTENNNISRVEATIPNELQFQKYHSNKTFTLKTLVNLDQNEYQLIFNKIFSYLLKNTKTEIIMKDAKLLDSTTAKFIRMTLQTQSKPKRIESLKHNFETLLDNYKTWYPNPEHKDKKYRVTRTTKLIYNELLTEAKDYIKQKKIIEQSLQKSFKQVFKNFNIQP